MDRSADRAGGVLRDRSRHLGSATIWLRDCRASVGPPRKRRRRRSGCPSWRRTCHLRCPCSWVTGQPAEDIRTSGRSTNGCPVKTPTARSTIWNRRRSISPPSYARCAVSTPPVGLRVPHMLEAGHSEKATSRFVDRSPSSATESPAQPASAPGRSRSTPRHGTTKRSGCTATCCRAICSSSRVGCLRSSISVASTWAIPHVTCSPRGTSSQVEVARGFDPCWKSTMRHGCVAAAGRSPRPCRRSRITGTPIPA